MPGLSCDIAESVATVTISNPAKRNAMTAQMWRDLPPLLATLTTDPAVRVLVLTGADGTFCAGADISALSAPGGENPEELAVTAEEALAEFPKPAIAAIAGNCVGGGCQLAAACDLRIAADDASFAVTPARLGIVYPPSAIGRLLGLVGPSATKYLIYRAERIPADHALRIGLVDELVPPDELAGRILDLAAEIAGRSQLTLRATKDLIARMTGETDVRSHEQVARTWMREARGSGEAVEGVSAFLQRRSPNFPWTG